MPSSSERRYAQMQSLVQEDQSALRRALADAVKFIQEYSDLLMRTPVDFIRGFLLREGYRNEGLMSAWANRETDPKGLEIYLQRAAREIEGLVERLHVDRAPEDDTSCGDPDIGMATRKMKELARLPVEFPSAFCESILVDHIDQDPSRDDLWTNRERNPAGVETLLRDAAYRLQTLANELLRWTKPSIDIGCSPEELFNMDEKTYRRAQNAIYRAREAAQRRH